MTTEESQEFSICVVDYPNFAENVFTYVKVSGQELALELKPHQWLFEKVNPELLQSKPQ